MTLSIGGVAVLIAIPSAAQARHEKAGRGEANPSRRSGVGPDDEVVGLDQRVRGMRRSGSAPSRVRETRLDQQRAERRSQIGRRQRGRFAPPRGNSHGSRGRHHGGKGGRQVRGSRQFHRRQHRHGRRRNRITTAGNRQHSGTSPSSSSNAGASSSPPTQQDLPVSASAVPQQHCPAGLPQQEQARLAAAAPHPHDRGGRPAAATIGINPTTNSNRTVRCVRVMKQRVEGQDRRGNMPHW